MRAPLRAHIVAGKIFEIVSERASARERERERENERGRGRKETRRIFTFQISRLALVPGSLLPSSGEDHLASSLYVFIIGTRLVICRSKRAYQGRVLLFVINQRPDRATIREFLISVCSAVYVWTRSSSTTPDYSRRGKYVRAMLHFFNMYFS